MRIAVVASDDQDTSNAALRQLASTLTHTGWRLAGTVQTNVDKPGYHHCDMDVRVLSDGPVIRISQTQRRRIR
ncbi:MAG: DUF2478 domain-containing protein [Paracoccaceae bacterium]